MGRGEEDKASTAEGGACRDQAHLGPCRSRRGGLRGGEGRAPGAGGEGVTSARWPGFRQSSCRLAQGKEGKPPSVRSPSTVEM